MNNHFIAHEDLKNRSKHLINQAERVNDRINKVLIISSIIFFVVAVAGFIVLFN